MGNSEVRDSRRILTLSNAYLKLPERIDPSSNCGCAKGSYANLSSVPAEVTLSKKTYVVNGKQIPGQSVDFEATSEPWSQYKLADGSEVKVKVVMMNVARLDDFTDAGDPIYQFQFQQIVSVVAPDNLKRKSQ